MYKTLGMVSFVLLIIVTAPYWVRFLNRKLFHHKGQGFNNLIKGLRKVHKPLGGALVLIALYHGFLALRAPRLHTGSLAWLLMGVTALFGVLFATQKKPAFFKWHKRLALVTVLFVLLHLTFPNALSGLFQ